MASNEEVMALDNSADSLLAQHNELMLNTIEVCDEEKKNLLSGVLECVVCLELPKRKQKVMICERGHHFCSNCHSRIDKCGLCRGKLLKSRNFVVEKLVTKLGPILGAEGALPPPETPVNYTPGSYQCQHNCPAKTPSHLMLPHIRSQHSSNLIDNMRSNPYNSQFSFSFCVQYKPDQKYVLSTQISDFGLFTLIIHFKNLTFFGFVKVLGDASVSSQFRYQLVVKITSKTSSETVRQFSVYNCSVSSYNEDLESVVSGGNLLKITDSDLLEYTNVGSPMNLFFSIQKVQKLDKRKSVKFSDEIIPDKPITFCNDRRVRRNKKRNMRRKRLRDKFKQLSISKEKMDESLEDISVLFKKI